MSAWWWLGGYVVIGLCFWFAATADNDPPTIEPEAIVIGSILWPVIVGALAVQKLTRWLAR